MTPIPYLFFKGTCEEALRTYARIFGSPDPDFVPAQDGSGGMMHAALRIGDGMIYASDWSGAEPMAGNSIHVARPTPEEARRLFDALAEGGTIGMPFEATFWSRGFGDLTDRFGIRWMVDTQDAPKEEAATAPGGEAVSA